jgi:hypothetical protein
MTKNAGTGVPWRLFRTLGKLGPADCGFERFQELGRSPKSRTTMKADGYNSDELKFFYRVLESAIAEAAAKAIDLPVQEITRRLFAAAERGERDESRLRLSIFGKSHQGSLAGSSARQRRPKRPLLTLFPKHPRAVKRPVAG